MANDMGEPAVRDILHGMKAHAMSRLCQSFHAITAIEKMEGRPGQSSSGEVRKLRDLRAQPKQMFYNGYQFGVRKQWMT